MKALRISVLLLAVNILTGAALSATADSVFLYPAGSAFVSNPFTVATSEVTATFSAAGGLDFFVADSAWIADNVGVTGFPGQAIYTAFQNSAAVTVQFDQFVNQATFAYAIPNPGSVFRVTAYLGGVPVKQLSSSTPQNNGFVMDGVVFDSLVISADDGVMPPDTSAQPLLLGVITVGPPVTLPAALTSAIQESQSTNSSAANFIDASFRDQMQRKVNDALQALAAGDKNACKQALLDLNWVINQVAQQTPKKISLQEASLITALANQIIASCP